MDTNEQKSLSHKEWRRIAKKERRRKIRCKHARERENDDDRLRETLERSAEYLKWIEEQANLEKENERREQEEHDHQERLWIEREVKAQDDWKLLQERRAKARAEQHHQEEILRKDFEAKQQLLNKQKEEAQSRQEEELKRQEDLRNAIDSYIDEGAKTPESLRAVMDSKPGKELCPFFAKTAACKYGDSCSRNHRRLALGKFLIIPGFYSHFSLERNSFEYDTDIGLEYDCVETQKDFRDFYRDILPELESFGRIKTLKFCRNTEVHLRGNLYVEYSSEREAARAWRKLHGRYYAGRQLNCEFANISSWRAAVCGLNRCPKGKMCNFLHTFRNPRDEYDILSPPRRGKKGEGENSDRRSEKSDRSTHMPPIQDITMNQTTYLGSGTNPRSPGKIPNGTASGHAGRTIKDYEDQLGVLQKENFNLKLRVYFLEEKMGISSADENTIKKNIELNVELESLKKDLIEKQELLSQAAKAFQLHEEQKEASARHQAQYQESLEAERRRIEELEQELSDYKEKMEPSIYYKEAFGITPESAMENKEKLIQMEELVESLEAEVKQLSASLEDERSWAQELETERDALRIRLEVEVKNREKLTAARDSDSDELRGRIKELEEEALKRESAVQQFKSELAEKDRLIREKISLLEEKCRACDELTEVAEKRKKQIDQLRTSVKSRDDALTDLNNKHRALLNQSENTLTRRMSPPGSPITYDDSSQGMRSGQRSGIVSPGKCNSPFDWDFRSRGIVHMNSVEEREVKELVKELEERDRKLKDQEETKKQLMLKLCNVQETAEATQRDLKKVQTDHNKALRMIQEFVGRTKHLEQKLSKKDKKIEELKLESTKLKESESRTKRNGQLSSIRRNLTPEMDDGSLEKKSSSQQRFEEMEIKINDLRDEIDMIKAEKNRLEKQIHDESEELHDQIADKQRRIDYLELEREEIKRELEDKENEIKHMTSNASLPLPEIEQQLLSKTREIEEKNQKIEQLSKDLQIKTQNLQKLVNTELWSKNKEIAKLHNHMTNQCHERSRNKSESQQDLVNSHLELLLKELNDIGVEVKFSEDIVHLRYSNQSLPDIKSLAENVQKLVLQKNDLEKEVEYLKWLKLISKTDVESDDSNGFESEKCREYCELLRGHLKSLVKFMKEMLKSSNYSINDEYKRMVLDVLVGSRILSEDFVQALEGVNSFSKRELTLEDICTCRDLKRSRSHLMDEKSDSEAFSEPDRSVSLARIGLQEIPEKSSRSRYIKYSKNFSDSEDSVDYVPYHKTYQSDLNEIDSSHHLQELKETNNSLYTELMDLRNDLIRRSPMIDVDEKLKPIILKIEKSQSFCDKLQGSLDKKMQESLIKKESKQNSVRKAQLEKKIVDVENMAMEIAKQKSELMLYKENNERKTAEMMMGLNMENEGLRLRVQKLEEENEGARGNVSMLTKELDRLTLSQSQVLVENTKLTNDKLRLEQDVRKVEARFEATLKSLKEKFEKEVADLNMINDSQRGRMQELEVANKELRRQVVVCETSDSAPSSSGISSIPTDGRLKQTCDDLIQEFHFNGSQYWQPLNYPPSTGRSKSSCSPDLGIESDAAVSTTRPLKDTLKITESMTNLLSDDENCNRGLRDLDRESPLHLEGLDEVEALKQENEALKRRLMKTKRALEDTFKHLSASNKNKKNVEKAITKQLMITKSILQKTRTYEEPFDN
ncbi:centrosomin-like isoform X3 [Diachasmimorpha longicaudata]|uniref:centrosomin-like isoform X3 n=1 Tax=Diachasmimorpha longicaudata TaxID=58733 RepID=UPI0030B8A627